MINEDKEVGPVPEEEDLAEDAKQEITEEDLQNGIEEHVDFSAKTFGYNFEIEHFNQLLRDHKKESELMSFSFSKDLIATIDLIRNKINLNY